MHREKIKQIGTRVTPEKHKAVETAAEKLGLNMQQAVEAAIDAFLSNAGLVIPLVQKPARRGSLVEQFELIAEKLQLLEVGQRHIQDGVMRVLGQITRGIPEQEPIESLGQKSHELEDERSLADREALRRASELIEKHGRGPKFPTSTKKDRSGKSGKTPGSDSRRSGS